MKKQLSILGSTGSIGCNVLKIVEMHADRFGVQALAAGKNTRLLADQIMAFKPQTVVVIDEQRARALAGLLPPRTRVEVLYGETAYCAAATRPQTDIVVGAMVGAAGLAPTLAAIDAGKTIALANKETLVMAGEIVMARAAEKGIEILPIDSEHSAIYQCMAGSRRADVQNIFLTGSGGPFRTRPGDDFGSITVQDALHHPNWKMGAKITIDSATLMNKGLEVIEASRLFNLPLEAIEVIIHPQSIVHSMVGFTDGSVIAQLGIPDMKGAIAYALSCPERMPIQQPPPDFVHLGRLTFEKPDLEKFPCLGLAFRAASRGGTLPAVLNAANEVAVQAFLQGRIRFVHIPRLIKTALDDHGVVDSPTLSQIMAADRWAREWVGKEIAASNGV